MTRPPRVLVVAGLDPSGGAGLLADAQALAAVGAAVRARARMSKGDSMHSSARRSTTGINADATTLSAAAP